MSTRKCLKERDSERISPNARTIGLLWVDGCRSMVGRCDLLLFCVHSRIEERSKLFDAIQVGPDVHATTLLYAFDEPSAPKLF